MKLPWPNPVLVFTKKGPVCRFRSLHHIVLIRETVPRVSVPQMAELQGMNQRFQTKLMACPFIVIDTGEGATAYSPDGTSRPVDLDALPLLDLEAHFDEGIILVNCSSIMAVYGLRGDEYCFRMHDLIMSSVMCMPNLLDEDDIPFLIERRRIYAEKQLANSRLVLQSGKTISLYDAHNFALTKTIYTNLIS